MYTVDIRFVSFKKINCRGKVEVVEDVGVIDGVDVAESDENAEGVETLELLAE